MSITLKTDVVYEDANVDLMTDGYTEAEMLHFLHLLSVVQESILRQTFEYRGVIVDIQRGYSINRGKHKQ